MPVLITITALLYLFRGGSSGGVSFFCPGALRKKAKKTLSKGAARDRTLGTVDQLMDLGERYSMIIEEGLDGYIDLTNRHRVSVREVESYLAPLDESRDQVLRDVIRIREKLKQEMTAEQWGKVFG